MVAWLFPALKAILPHVSTIISAAAPAFTTRKADGAAAAQTGLLQQQIAELQTAASRNAEHIRELAEQLQKTVDALEQGASMAQSAQKRTAALCAIAIAASIVAVIVSLVAFFSR